MMSSTALSDIKNVFAEFLKNYRYSYRSGMLDELECSDLTFRQFVYLDTILKMDKPTYGDIAKKFNITKPSVTTMVNRLISLGYLERVQSEDDRRVYHVTAGKKGSAMLSVDNDAVEGLARQIAACLSEAEVASYISLTERINAGYVSKKD